MENILLQRPTLPVVITITDFGYARHEPCPPQRMRSFCGTIEFLAPEMIRALPKARLPGFHGYGKEIDIWAIGVIAFVVISGRFPFSGNDEVKDNEILKRILHRCVSFNTNWKSKSGFGMFLWLEMLI
jgi:serine/threonine protein kinase